jgi:hypothetical protein
VQENNPNDPTLVNAIVEKVIILGKGWDKATKTVTLDEKPKEAIKATDIFLFVKREENSTNMARVSARKISLKSGTDLSLSDGKPIEITITTYENTEFKSFTIDVKVKLK